MTEYASVSGLAASLDLPDITTSDGAELPALWHWLLFPDHAPAHMLGSDGHRAAGGLLAYDPAVPRRMWVGGRLRFAHPVRIGQALRRDSTVLRRQDRDGRSGRLHFVTLGHTIMNETGVAIEEEQDLVFRPPASSATARPEAAPPPPAHALLQDITPETVLLFRFSALTFNAHRIHYDQDYAQHVERYPGLVVQGPLQAILLANLLRRALPHRRLRSFAFRGHHPAIAGNRLQLAAWQDPAAPHHWQARSTDAAGALCMSADAELDQV